MYDVVVGSGVCRLIPMRNQNAHATHIQRIRGDQHGFIEMEERKKK